MKCKTFQQNAFQVKLIFHKRTISLDFEEFHIKNSSKIKFSRILVWSLFLKM
jgi:hypothetical protein